MTNPAVVVFSGGLDSTVTLAQAVEEVSGPITALSFAYGQRHESSETRAALEIAGHYGVGFKSIDLAGLLHSRSLLSNSPEEIPEGEYGLDNLPSTEVRGRNLLFASLAVAQVEEGASVWLGVHGGDHDLYPDCRPAFWDGLVPVVAGLGVSLRVPFLRSSKAEIVRKGAALDAPLHLTWSCYNGGAQHCGRCATCLERRAAFEEAGVADPTQYLP